MKDFIINNFIWLVKKIFFFYGLCSDKNKVLFVPHSGMCRIDLYDIVNYKSDSALSFLNYILENNLLQEKEILVAIRDDIDKQYYYDYVQAHFFHRKVKFVSMFFNKSYSKFEKLKQRIAFCRMVSGCSHIFASMTHDFSGLISNQIVVDLNYFTSTMKNDICEKGTSGYTGIEKVGREYSYIVGTSEIAIRLILSEMTVPYKKYINLGLCRNDYLLNGEKCEWLRKEIQDKVSYEIKRIILYTPTHRDYEAHISFSKKRSILGFSYDPESFGTFLKNNGIVFICKLHPKQNALVVENQLPEGLILHKPDMRYGLTELMQVSDSLVTDYTSAYFDYLLLDKPIIFNYYDLEIYKKERGVPCEPMSAISAGEIVRNEEEMMQALLNLDTNKVQFSQMRKFIRNLFFTSQDTNSCKRVYNFIFVENENN